MAWQAMLVFPPPCHLLVRTCAYGKVFRQCNGELVSPVGESLGGQRRSFHPIIAELGSGGLLSDINVTNDMLINPE